MGPGGNSCVGTSGRIWRLRHVAGPLKLHPASKAVSLTSPALNRMNLIAVHETNDFTRQDLCRFGHTCSLTREPPFRHEGRGAQLALAAGIQETMSEGLHSEPSWPGLESHCRQRFRAPSTSSRLAWSSSLRAGSTCGRESESGETRAIARKVPCQPQSSGCGRSRRAGRPERPCRGACMSRLPGPDSVIRRAHANAGPGSAALDHCGSCCRASVQLIRAAPGLQASAHGRHEPLLLHGTARLHGQTMSFPIAKAMSASRSISPPVIRSFVSLSFGGRPVTASHA